MNARRISYDGRSSSLHYFARSLVVLTALVLLSLGGGCKREKVTGPEDSGDALPNATGLAGIERSRR